jgi:stearoyl-CoA desaturase (delta-9 desaturase)
MSPCRSFRQVNVTNLLFFSSITLLAVIGVPWYWTRVGISRLEWTLVAGFVVATGLSITIGYHRLFAHRAFKASRTLTFLSLFFGAAAFEQSALMWASQHRDHHRFVDTPKDPYNIKQGFWYAHMGWMLFWCQETDYSNVRDLAADPLIAHQHRYYLLWAAGAGILLPLAIGAATGHLLGALILVVAARLTFVHHSTFCINSVCHTFGRATYDIDSTARDHWLVALITFGEGYHNFHHRFASDYRNGVRWYHWDPSKWLIALLSWVGLARQLYRVSPQTILAARLAAQQLRVERTLARRTEAETGEFLQTVRERYAQLKHALYEWERWEKELRRIGEAAGRHSQNSLAAARLAAREHRRTFQRNCQQWAALINRSPLTSQAIRV